MIRLGIFGGCVSRDVISYAKREDNLSLAFYTARCSFASLAGKPYIQQHILNRFTSKFQREQISADMRKTFFNTLTTTSFDLILLDFISQKYSVLSDRQGGLLTMSNDYMRRCPRPFEGRVIRSTTEMYSRLWSRGFEKFFSAVSRAGKAHRVILSELYWTKETLGSEPFPDDVIDAVDRENEHLRSLYGKFTSLFGRENLIHYPDELLIADPAHRWGHSPFHYSAPLYRFTLENIKRIAAKC